MKETQCYNCSGFGHIAANCRKGKGKGKGNYKGGGRVTYGQYTKGKSYGKSGYNGGKRQGSWGKGGYVPLTERECNKCGQKGHIAVNCPSKCEAGQAQGQGSYITAPNIPLGQPQGIYHVEPIEPLRLKAPKKENV